MRAERTFPPNCEVRNSNPSRLLLFLDRQREIFGEYGFMLGVKLRTEEEREGKKRYQRDWHKRYRDEHRAEQRVRRHDYWVTVEKRGFKCKLEAVAPERLAEKREKAIRRKERADQKKLVRQEYGFDLHVTPRTPEEEAGRRRYRLEMMREYRRKIRETDPARREENNARRREMNRRRFEERMRELERVDPVAAAKERERYENRCRLIAMSEEERAERRERKLAEKRKRAKAAARLKEKRKKAKARRAEQAAINTKRNVKRFGEMVRKRARIKRIEINKRKKEERQERWRNRIAECAARREAEKALEEKYRREREENLKRYLERKGMRDEEEGMRKKG